VRLRKDTGTGWVAKQQNDQRVAAVSGANTEVRTDVNNGGTEASIDAGPVGADTTDSAVADQPGDLSLTTVAAEQRRDTDILPIIELLERKAEKPSWDDIASRGPTTKALWQQWPRLLVRDGVLYRRFDQPDGGIPRLQLVVPFKLRRQMFCAVHEGVTGGHMGRRRTEHQLQSRAYWPGWSGDVRRFLKMCDPCAQYHRGGPLKLATLKPFLAGDVFETVSIDVTGPHPRSRHGNVYMLTIMDHFSKWADAFPVTNHTAATVARVLFNKVFVYLGMPLRILSDQGPEFQSNLFQELCRWMNIEKVRTTPYKASTNGMVERYHRTLNSILAKMIVTNQRDWCERVPTAAAAYRASVHEATGFSPNFIVFGRENRMPVDLVCGCPPGDEEHYTSVDETVAQRQEMTREVYETVRLHLGEAAVRRKDRYDMKVKEMQFAEGTWVWYLYPRRRVGISAKWQKFYTGPYQIVQVIEPNNVVLQKSRRGKPFVVHRDKVKLFSGDPPNSWEPRTTASQVPDGADIVDGRRLTENRNATDGNGADDATVRDRRNDGDDGDVEERKADAVSLTPNLSGSPPGSGPDLPDSDHVRPARNRQRPLHLNDYSCHVTAGDVLASLDTAERRGGEKKRCREMTSGVATTIPGPRDSKTTTESRL